MYKLLLPSFLVTHIPTHPNADEHSLPYTHRPLLSFCFPLSPATGVSARSGARLTTTKKQYYHQIRATNSCSEMLYRKPAWNGVPQLSVSRLIGRKCDPSEADCQTYSKCFLHFPTGNTGKDCADAFCFPLLIRFLIRTLCPFPTSSHTDTHTYTHILGLLPIHAQLHTFPGAEGGRADRQRAMMIRTARERERKRAPQRVFHAVTIQTMFFPRISPLA